MPRSKRSQIEKTVRKIDKEHFLISEDENEYGSFSLWGSRQEAESAGESVRSKTREVLEKLAVEPLQQVFEVYKPKS